MKLKRCKPRGMPINALPPSCPTCKRAMWSSGAHVCPPQWSVWNPDQEEEEDARVFFADDPETAAEEWGEKDDSDSADYDIVKGKPAIVSVRRYPPEEGVAPLKFRVQGEYDPRYWAEPVE